MGATPSISDNGEGLFGSMEVEGVVYMGEGVAVAIICVVVVARGGAAVDSFNAEAVDPGIGVDVAIMVWEGAIEGIIEGLKDIEDVISVEGGNE